LKHHKGLPVINSSRSIIYAGGDSEEWMELVAEKAQSMKETLKVITQRYV